MPLDGFKILNWVSVTFGGLPPLVIGGLGVAALIVGVTLMVIGAKMVPASWGLIVAGGGCVTLTYFIVGAAIATSGSTLEGGQQVAGAAPRAVPIAVATVLIGLAMFGGRSTLRSWVSEESSGKVTAVILGLASLGLVFLGVQVVRGSFFEIQQAPPAETEPEDSTSAPEPIHRGLTAPRRH